MGAAIASAATALAASNIFLMIGYLLHNGRGYETFMRRQSFNAEVIKASSQSRHDCSSGPSHRPFH
jgi:hypothetical protein